MTSQTQPPASTRGRRAPLSRQRVLETALELVDRDGLHELSMRKLASTLDVEAMSLYRHVTNKDDLLAGLAELLWAEIAVAAPADPDWTTWLRTFGHALRDAIHRHPNALPVLLSGDVTPIPALELFADQLEYADPSSHERYQAVSALRTVAAFALGCAVTELSCFGPTPTTEETDRDRLLRVSRALPPDTPDRLLDVAITVCGECDALLLFTEGLNLIIRGCETQTMTPPSTH